MVATRETGPNHDDSAMALGITHARRDALDHDRRRGAGEHAWQIRRVFDVYCRKYGLNRDVRPLSKAHFRRPSLHGQISLFGDG